MREKARSSSIVKRLLAFIAALAMVLTMGVGSAIPAMAATKTITINNNHPVSGTEDGPDYHWYVMMWASVGSNNSVSYYVDKEALATALDGLTVDSQDLFTVTRVGTENRWNVVINKKSDNTDFTGEEVAAALDGISNKDTLAEQSGEVQRSTEATKTFTINDNGYLLITSSLGTKLILNTVTDGTTINEKNTYPSSEKQQSLSQNSGYSKDFLSAEVGTTVYYHVNITVPSTASKAIRVVDTMSEGLTMNTAISWSGTHGTTGSGSWSEVSPTPTGTPSGSKVYEFTLSEETVKSMAASMRNATPAISSTTVTLSYSATVNENAVKTDDAETNKAHIEYDNYVTPDDSVEVYTYKFNLLKYDPAISTTTPLAGAHFQLLKGDSKTEVTLVRMDNNGHYRVATSTDTSTARDIVTIAGSNIQISGLDKNTTYYLRETQAPAGYNRLTDDVQVNFDNSGTGTTKLASTDGKTPADPVVQIENHQGSVLPSTGGIGTTIFYVIGGVLVAGAVILLVSRRRRA